MTNFSHIQGDTFIKNINFTKDDTAIDITGSTSVFTIRKKLGGTIILQQNLTIVDAVSGQTKVQFSKEEMDLETGYYYYDVQFTDSQDIRSTVVKGSIHITYDIT